MIELSIKADTKEDLDELLARLGCPTSKTEICKESVTTEKVIRAQDSAGQDPGSAAATEGKGAQNVTWQNSEDALLMELAKNKAKYQGWEKIAKRLDKPLVTCRNRYYYLKRTGPQISNNHFVPGASIPKGIDGKKYKKQVITNV